MSVYIHQIDTIVPGTTYKQDFIRDLMKTNVSDERKVKSIIHRIYGQSGIEKRHSVIRDFNLNGHPALFFDTSGNALPAAGTKSRNDVYIREAKPLFCKLAENTIRKTAGFSKDDITHVITVSCTGFFAPGPDFHIVRELGLNPSVQRYHVGFMGCYAAFPALKMAKAFCEADPEAVVLIVSVELCTLHLQLRDDPDYIISASVFSDGGGSALVSARKPGEESQSLMIKQLGSNITPTGEDDMAWTIGDSGFEMTLSTYIPEIIKANIAPIIYHQLGNAGLKIENIGQWAIHPGGRAILDKIQQSMNLTNDQVASSRNILENYGNMSSATILFVIKDLLSNPGSSSKARNLLAMAFGPGLTVETGVFEVTQAESDHLSIDSHACNPSQKSETSNRTNGSA